MIPLSVFLRRAVYADDRGGIRARRLRSGLAAERTNRPGGRRHVSDDPLLFHRCGCCSAS
jgi:hypothetical protein